MFKRLLAGVMAAVALAGTAGEPIPYTHVFDNPKCLDGFTTIHTSSSTLTQFQWNDRFGDGTQTGARCRVSLSAEKNDWLVTPALSLVAGKNYKVHYKIASGNNQQETFGIYVGDQPTLSSLMSNVILAPQTYWFEGSSRDKALDFFAEFKADKTGDQYVGIWVTAPVGGGDYMYITEMDVTELAGGAVPAAPVDFSAVADEMGRPVVALSCVAPSVGADGSSITSLSKLEFLCDGNVINTVNNPVPGTKYEYTYNNAPLSNHIYSAVAYNDEGVGVPVEKSVKVGSGVSTPLTDVTVTGTANPDVVRLSWTAPTLDVNNNMMAIEAITYKIYAYIGDDKVGEYTAPSGTSTEITLNADQNSQAFYWFEVIPVTAGGEGQATSTGRIAIGKADETPWSEGFANGKVSHAFDTRDDIRAASGLRGTWEFRNDVNGDRNGDRGYARFYGNGQNAQGDLSTGRIALPAGTRMTLSFAVSTLRDTDNPSTLDVRISADGGEFTDVAHVEAKTAAWAVSTVDLAPYAGKTIQIAFRGTFGMYSTWMALDDINIKSSVDADLAIVDYVAPTAMEMLSPYQLMFRVKNLGTVEAENYTFTLKANDVVVKTLQGSKLMPDQTYDFEFDYTPERGLELVTFVGELNWDGDLNAANNVSPALRAPVSMPEQNPVTNLAAELINDNTGVRLTWDAPEGADEESENPYRKLLGYTIIRDGAAVNVVVHKETTWEQTDLTPGTYKYQVRAVFVEGRSEPCDEVEVTIPEKTEPTPDPEPDPAGIDGINADAAQAIYFDLNGLRVYNPKRGQALIKVQSCTAQKIIF